MRWNGTATRQFRDRNILLHVRSTAEAPIQSCDALRAVGAAGLVCGILDITAALLVYGYFGLQPMRLLQGIAAGILGTRAFEGGTATALLGLLCHFLIAFGAATVYVAVSRRSPFLVRQAVASGALYGIAVYFFMKYVVVALSAAVKYPFSWQGMLIGVTIHIFCVGIPISLATRHFLRP
jgi:hypothetical protein